MAADRIQQMTQHTNQPPVAQTIAGGIVCIGLACIAVWNELQQFPHPIHLSDWPAIAGRQVAAIALFFVGSLFIWFAWRSRKQA